MIAVLVVATNGTRKNVIKMKDSIKNNSSGSLVEINHK